MRQVNRHQHLEQQRLQLLQVVSALAARLLGVLLPQQLNLRALEAWVVRRWEAACLAHQVMTHIMTRVTGYA